MFYNQNVKTHVLEPVSHTLKRSEFRLADKKGLFMSNLRLCDLGVTLNAPDASNNTFNDVLGNFAIKNMYLYDGRVELSKLTEGKEWASWIHRNRSNEDCTNLKVLDGTSLGYTIETNTTLKTQNTFIMYPNSNNVPYVDESLTPKQYLPLRSYLPMLKAVSFLHTDIFSDLRLVIEYDYKDVMCNGDRALTNTIPKLVMDEILNEKLANNVKQDFFKSPIVWDEIENEKFLMPSVVASAGATSQTQKVSLRSTGFKNKLLGRILLQKRAKGKTFPCVRNQYSQNLFNELEQIRVNGVDLIPDSGCGSSAYRIGLVSDTWGNYCCATSSNQLGLISHEDEVNKLTNSSNYFGMRVDKKIDYLQLNINRDYLNTLSSNLNDTIELILFGECKKTIVPDKFAGYQVVYV